MTFLQRVLNKLKFTGTTFLSNLFHSKVRKFNPRFEINYPKDETIEFFFDQIHCYDLKPYWLDFKRDQFFSSFTITEKNCSIIRPGIVVREDGRVNMESCLFQDEYLNKSKANHLIYWRNLLPTKNLNKVICLSNFLEKGYYHWILEALGKLTLVDPQKLNEYQILIGSHPSKFMIDSLFFLFGIDRSQILMSNKSIYQANECLVISNPYHRSARTSNTNVHKPSTMKKINQLALNHIPKNAAPVNILISRSNAGQRRMYGEEKIVEAFPELNFKLVKLEELSFHEQVELFSSAHIVIGTHGAGFTNLLFSRNAKVIELFPKRRPINSAFCFTEISSALGFEHHLVGYDEDNTKDQDLYLEQKHINQIREILSTI